MDSVDVGCVWTVFIEITLTFWLRYSHIRSVLFQY